MFVREKTARGHGYLYLVENQRDGGRIRQRMIRALGRKDVLLASGELDRLTASLARHCDRAVMLSDMEAGRIACTRIVGRLLFGQLWERLGIAEVLRSQCRTSEPARRSSSPLASSTSLRPSARMIRWRMRPPSRSFSTR